MNSDLDARQMASVGLRGIEDAILSLLSRNPQGLRNSEIATALGLRSDVQGSQRNYLTYSVLGGLLAQDKIARDPETKLFTTTDVNRAEVESAIGGLRQIEGAILSLLSRNSQGLRNSEIANALDLRSDVQGSQRNYLTYSVLGGLLAQNKVARDPETRFFTAV